MQVRGSVPVAGVGPLVTIGVPALGGRASVCISPGAGLCGRVHEAFAGIPPSWTGSCAGGPGSRRVPDGGRVRDSIRGHP